MPKLVYIAHRINEGTRESIEKNIRNVKRVMSEVHTSNVIPMAPYLTAFEYLNDNVPEERRKGMDANKLYFERRIMDETWLCGPAISRGMTEEIKLSLSHEIPVVCHNPDLAPSYQKIERDFLSARKLDDFV